MAKAQVEETEEGGIRSRMHLHKALAEYLGDNYGITDKSSAADTIAAAFAKRNEWRATPEYLKLREEHAGEPRKAAGAKKAASPRKATKKAAAAKKSPAKKAAPRKATKKAGGGGGENPFG